MRHRLVVDQHHLSAQSCFRWPQPHELAHECEVAGAQFVRQCAKLLQQCRNALGAFDGSVECAWVALALDGGIALLDAMHDVQLQSHGRALILIDAHEFFDDLELIWRQCSYVYVIFCQFDCLIF